MSGPLTSPSPSTGRGWRTLCAALCLALVPLSPNHAQQPARQPDDIYLKPTDVLSSTIHPPLPQAIEEMWLVPSDGEQSQLLRAPGVAGLVRGVQEFDSGNYAAALPLVSVPSLASTPLGPYAVYYTALIRLRLAQAVEARRIFAELRTRPIAGFLSEAAALGEAEAADAQGDFDAALQIYEQLVTRRTVKPEDIAMRMARSAEAAGQRDRAVSTLLRVMYEFALTDQAAAAESELRRLGAPLGGGVSPDRFKAELGRAERLFATRRYTEARPIYEMLRPYAEEDDRELVSLRLAECDHYQRRHRAARDGLTPYLERASRVAEARFFYLTSTRELGDHDEYVRLSEEFVAAFPDSSWTEEALNNLASHHIRANDDAAADVAFRQLVARFPDSRHAERAAWKVGWWSYKNGRFDDSVRVFESAAARFTRSDYRPAYLYWAARSHDRLNNRPIASERYALVAADYLNSYYGRLASSALTKRGDKRAHGIKVAPDLPATTGSSESGSQAPEPQMPANAAMIRHLIAAGLLADAEHELMFAQRVFGDSPAVQATLAWVYNRRGEYRRGTLLMKRAYPQHLTAGGTTLPVEMLRVVYPLDFWSLIRPHAEQRRLDPYLMAALVAQESTFVPDIRSSANAIGLMQILPATGRRYARTLGIRRFSASMLERPETNVRLGTTYYSDLVRRFGGDHLALASYNAGEHRVVRWMAERPGLERDEFIDDIPFPETQNYVKKVLGMAEDYRRLYSGTSVPNRGAVVKPLPAVKTPATRPATKKPAARNPPVRRAKPTPSPR